MSVPRARRLDQLPPYLFIEIDRAKRAAMAAGHDVIDLGVGDPDQPTLAPVVARMQQAVADPANHRYPFDAGLSTLRETIAAWYRRRYQVTLDPQREILPLIGSKEGLAHLPLAVLNPGEAALVPNPCYPPYRSGTLFAGGEVVDLPLLESHGFFPDWNAVPAATLARAKLLFLNYPNNPTSAIASDAQLDGAIAFARTHNLVLAWDAAYAEMTYDGYCAPSILQRPGGKDVAVEFHSCSKTYNMTGWRIGWACGNAEVIAALAKVKSHVDSGVFHAVQQAAVAALELPDSALQPLVRMYQERRDLLVSGLAKLGWTVPSPKATFYVWARVPRGTSMSFAAEALERAHLVITPGVGFGSHGEGYVRMALTVSKERLTEAVDRLRWLL